MVLFGCRWVRQDAEQGGVRLGEGQGVKEKGGVDEDGDMRRKGYREDIQLNHQRHSPVRSQHDRTRAIIIPVIAGNDQPTRHQQGEEKGGAEKVKKQHCESEVVEYASEVDEAC